MANQHDSPKPELDVHSLHETAKHFAAKQSELREPKLYGVTDGKAVGTYLEGRFIAALASSFDFRTGNAAKGIDLPGLGVDIKTTSIRQPQSSSPFSSGRQKIYGLGYDLLVFVYEKEDDPASTTAVLNILHVIFVRRERTGDFQMTKGIREITSSGGNEDDVIAFMQDRMLPVDDVEATRLAAEVIARPPEQGYLTISNALQWRLQYKRVIDVAGTIEGVDRVR